MVYTYNGNVYTYKNGMILKDGKPKMHCPFGESAFKLWAESQGFQLQS